MSEFFFHRWQLRRFLTWALPLLLLVISLMACNSLQRKRAGTDLRIADEAYRDLVMAKTWSEQGVYGATANQPSPAIRDVLWRGALAGLYKITDKGMQAAFWFGLLASLGTLWLVLRLARQLFPYEPFLYVAAILLVWGPGLISSALSGLSLPLGTFLVMAAVSAHFDGLRDPAQMLPLTSALLLGLALWLRVEFALLWIILVVHALLHRVWRSDSEKPAVGVILVRGLNGLLILALFLSPLLAWNMHVLKYPWPRMPGVPMAGDLWMTADLGASLALMAHHMVDALGEAFGRLAALGPLAGPIGILFYLLGLGLLIHQSLRSQEERPFVFLGIAPLLVPVFFALIYPHTGWSAYESIAMSVQPMLWLVVAYGVIRLPLHVYALREKWFPNISPRHFLILSWSVPGALLALWLLGSMVTHSKAQARQVEDIAYQRNLISAAIEHEGLLRDLFVSDEPGWLKWEHQVAVIDLTGEWDPELLYCVDQSGHLDPDRTERLLEKASVDTVLLWSMTMDEIWSQNPVNMNWVLRAEEYDRAVPQLFMIDRPDVL